MVLHTHFDPEVRTYLELTSHFAYRNFGFLGDAVVAFVGPCAVSGDALVDLVDKRAGDFIRAAAMLHFIGEHFGVPLREGVWRQRLFAAIVMEVIAGLGTSSPLRRTGDDLFCGERKLSVSIATQTPTSSIFHFGVNVDAGGAPVPAVGLNELGVKAEEVARAALALYAREDAGALEAAAKVRGIC